MKHLKKYFAAALTLVMALAIAVPAYAVSITVNKDATAPTQDSTTYTAYKILDATYETNTTTAGGAGDGVVSYTISAGSPWYTAVSGLTEYFTLTATQNKDANNNVIYNVQLKSDSLNTEATAKAIAAALEAYIDATGTGAVTTNTSDAVEENGVSLTAGTAADVSKGYYLITSSAGTNLILATTDITITEKNKYIIDGKVAETASVGVGQDATYYIVVTIPDNVDITKPVIVHDQLPSVLSFNNDVKVYSETTTSTSPTSSTPVATLKGLTYSDLTAGVEDVYTSGDNLSTGDSFVIKLTATTLAGKTLVFKYSAKVTQAAVDDTGYVNKEFSSHADYTTEPSQPKVYTFDFNLDKDFFNGTTQNNSTSLQATFELQDKDGNLIKVIANGDNKFEVAEDQTASSALSEFTVKNGTNITIGGLAEGVYYLAEKSVTDGYNLKTDKTKVEIKDATSGTTIDCDVFVDGGNTAATDDTVLIENYSGVELPSTGGMGTTILYVVGGLMVVGGGIALITKKRMAATE